MKHSSGMTVRECLSSLKANFVTMAKSEILTGGLAYLSLSCCKTCHSRLGGDMDITCASPRISLNTTEER